MAAGAATWLVAARVGIRAGITLLTTAGVLMAHDWHDRSRWFERGWQDEQLAQSSPIENIASRSWREKTSKATIVCVLVTPSSWASCP